MICQEAVHPNVFNCVQRGLNSTLFSPQVYYQNLGWGADVVDPNVQQAGGRPGAAGYTKRAVQHMGDNLTGEGKGDDEEIHIFLNAIPVRRGDDEEEMRHRRRRHRRRDAGAGDRRQGTGDKT